MMVDCNKSCLLKNILKRMDAVVYIHDLKTQRHVWTNGKYTDMLGYSEDEVKINVMEFAEKYYHPDDKPLMKEIIEYFYKNNGSFWSGMYRIKHKQGYWVWVFSKISVFERDEEGNVEKLIGIVTDHTQKLKTDRQLNEFFKEYMRLKNHTRISMLTKREKELLPYFAKGFLNKEIAEKMHIAECTVKTHKQHIMQKLKIKHSAELICFIVESRLI